MTTQRMACIEGELLRCERELRGLLANGSGRLQGGRGTALGAGAEGLAVEPAGPSIPWQQYASELEALVPEQAFLLGRRSAFKACNTGQALCDALQGVADKILRSAKLIFKQQIDKFTPLLKQLEPAAVQGELSVGNNTKGVFLAEVEKEIRADAQYNVLAKLVCNTKAAFHIYYYIEKLRRSDPLSSVHELVGKLKAHMQLHFDMHALFMAHPNDVGTVLDEGIKIDTDPSTLVAEIAPDTLPRYDEIRRIIEAHDVVVPLFVSRLIWVGSEALLDLTAVDNALWAICSMLKPEDPVSTAGSTVLGTGIEVLAVVSTPLILIGSYYTGLGVATILCLIGGAVKDVVCGAVGIAHQTWEDRERAKRADLFPRYIDECVAKAQGLDCREQATRLDPEVLNMSPELKQCIKNCDSTRWKSDSFREEMENLFVEKMKAVPGITFAPGYGNSRYVMLKDAYEITIRLELWRVVFQVRFRIVSRMNRLLRDTILDQWMRNPPGGIRIEAEPIPNAYTDLCAAETTHPDQAYMCVFFKKEIPSISLDNYRSMGCEFVVGASGRYVFGFEPSFFVEVSLTRGKSNDIVVVEVSRCNAASAYLRYCIATGLRMDTGDTRERVLPRYMRVPFSDLKTLWQNPAELRDAIQRSFPPSQVPRDDGVSMSDDTVVTLNYPGGDKMTIYFYKCSSRDAEDCVVAYVATRRK
jgi:hypothetical protein